MFLQQTIALEEVGGVNMTERNYQDFQVTWCAVEERVRWHGPNVTGIREASSMVLQDLVHSITTTRLR